MARIVLLSNDYADRAAALPLIVRFLGADDAPDSVCPHCGATGRRIYRFVTSDGRTRGAMSGCVKLFPVSPVAREELRLREKEARYAAQGWGLNGLDARALASIDAFYSGVGDESSAMAAVRAAKQATAARVRR